MAGTHARHPIRSPLSKEEIDKGCIYFLKPSGESDDCKISDVLSGEGKEKLKKSRLIVVPLPDELKPSSLKDKTPSEKIEDRTEGVPIDAQDIPYEPAMPEDHDPGNPPSRRNTGAISCGATCNKVQSRYESRFRPWKARDEKEACFLQFHTMQAPVLADWELTMALVHHLSISKSRSDQKVIAPFDEEHRNEQIFAFLYVKHEDWETNQIRDMTAEVIEQHLLPSIQLFKEERPGYVKDPEYANGRSKYRGVDPSGGSIGLTPMLFMGVLLKWYGFKAAHVVVNSFNDLIEIDRELLEGDKIVGDEIVWYSDFKMKAEECNILNARLAMRNKALIGLRSRVNYVADTARNMITDTCTMKEFVTDELNSGEYDDIRSRKSLKRALGLLDSSRFVRRDNDKLDLIARAMQQYCVDIKSLRTHMTINIGLVANHYSHLLAKAAERDSLMMLVLTVIGVIFLPFTFAAVLLTAPMFDFTASTTDWITISRKLARDIWGAISGILYLGILLIFPGIFSFEKEQRRKERKRKQQEEDKRNTERNSPPTVQEQSESPDENTIPIRPQVGNGCPV